MPFSHLTDQQQLIVDDIRTEICLSDHRQKIIFRESEIAKRFGVSRTPVRQVLQYLAHCLMVEIHRGYGTVARPLIEGKRNTEFNAYIAIASACAATLKDVSISKTTVVELVGLDTWLSLLEQRSEQEFVELNKRLINVMTSIVEDGLLKHAYSSAHWRVVRWRILDIRENNELNWQKLEFGLKDVIKTAMQRDAAALLQFAAQMGERHLHPEKDYYASGMSGSSVRLLD